MIRESGSTNAELFRALPRGAYWRVGRIVSEGVLETRGRKIGLLKVESPSLNVSQEFLIV